MTQEQIDSIHAAQQEYRAFTATVAGKAFRAFCNCLVTETQFGEKEYPSARKLRELSDQTGAQQAALVTEIKRLQASEAEMLAALLVIRDFPITDEHNMDAANMRKLAADAIAKATGAAP